MDSSTLRASVSRRRPRGLVSLLTVITLLAAVPLVYALARDGDATPRTAFATAAQGDYVVVAADTAEGDAEVISVATASDPTALIEIATVTHLTNFGSLGAVSPDGTLLALVVVDAGSPSHPGASLLSVDLLTGAVTRLAIELDYLQPPVWAADSASIVVTRAANDGGPRSDISVVRVAADLTGEVTLEQHPGVLGAYPVAFDPQGRLITIVITGDGSQVYRDGQPLLSLGASVTRDWALSPDGSALAYIETSLGSAVIYLPRVVTLDESEGGVSAQSIASDEGQALGAVWDPAAAAPAFGHDPSTAGVSAQSTGPVGFDIPIDYTADGSALVVQHWTGDSFAAPGDPAWEIVAGETRTPISATGRVYGWATR